MNDCNDIRNFSDDELRAYLAGRKSPFTVRELEFLDSVFEDAMNPPTQTNDKRHEYPRT